MSFEDLVGLFCGKMGRPISEFMELTPKYLFVIISAHSKETKRVFQNEWEQIRWQTHLLLMPHRKKGARVKLEDLALFPWEGKELKVSSQTDIEAMLERINKRDKADYKIKKDV